MDEPFFAKLRELNQGNIDDDASIQPESWDSVELLDLIAAIDESYDVTVPVERLKACRTVDDLRQLIRAETAAS